MYTHREEMTHGDGQADGERSGAIQVTALGVDGSKDGEDEHEGDEDLHAQALARVDAVADHGTPEVPVVLLGRQPHQDARAHHGPHQLKQHEEDGLGQGNLARGEQCQGDGGVDVAPGDVGDVPDDGGHAEAEAERDLHDGRGAPFLQGDAGAAAYKHQQKDADELGDDAFPQRAARAATRVSSQ